MPEIATAATIDRIDFREGAMLLVDKPAGWTSFDVVNKIRAVLRHQYLVRKIKVGHAGTLDPMATGLLILCTGKATGHLADLQGLEKEYSGEMILGATTASYDRETPVESPKPFEHLSEQDIHAAALGFVGNIDQLPPMYSAVKVEGMPLYRAARKGKEVEREPRQVEIRRFDILSVNLPVVTFYVACSKGTYIRTLVHDLGQVLGCGAYLSALHRTRIGEFSVEHAWNLEELVVAIQAKE